MAKLTACRAVSRCMLAMLNAFQVLLLFWFPLLLPTCHIILIHLNEQHKYLLFIQHNAYRVCISPINRRNRSLISTSLWVFFQSKSQKKVKNHSIFLSIGRFGNCPNSLMYWWVNTHMHRCTSMVDGEKKPSAIWLLTEGLKADECWQHPGKDTQRPSASQSTSSQVEIHKYKVIQFKSILLTEKHPSFVAVNCSVLSAVHCACWGGRYYCCHMVLEPTPV